MPPAALAALSGGGAATSAAKHLFSPSPSSPSFNDPLPSSLSPPISLPKTQTKKSPNPKHNKDSSSQSLSLHTRYRKPVNPISSTGRDPSVLVGPFRMSYRFHSPPSDPQNTNPNPKTPKGAAFKTTHLRTHYHKPVCPRSEHTVLSSEESTGGDRSVLVGPNGVSYRLPDAPFDFQFSYSETPRVAPLAIREPAFLPFAPPSMPRPWTGKAPLLSKKEKEMKKGRKINLVEPLGSGARSSEVKEPGLVREVRGKKGLNEQLRLGLCKIKDSRSREEILGEPLSRFEIRRLIKPHLSHNRQVNLGTVLLIHFEIETQCCIDFTILKLWPPLFKFNFSLNCEAIPN